jgi:hypothetical protein
MLLSKNILAYICLYIYMLYIRFFWAVLQRLDPRLKKYANIQLHSLCFCVNMFIHLYINEGVT